MSDLGTLDPQLDKAQATCRIVIEAPKGGRAKLAYDPEAGAFELKRMLPDGMTFPLDFGSYPRPAPRMAIPLMSWCSMTSRRRSAL